jgi:hypothetical protein
VSSEVRFASDVGLYLEIVGSLEISSFFEIVSSSVCYSRIVGSSDVMGFPEMVGSSEGLSMWMESEGEMMETHHGR